jgi:hypothetical protein
MNHTHGLSSTSWNQELAKIMLQHCLDGIFLMRTKSDGHVVRDSIESL